MVEKIAHLEKVSNQLNLRFRPSKCVYYHNPNDEGSPIQIYGTRIPTVDEIITYKYLGIPFGEPKRQDMPEILDAAIKDFEAVADCDLHPVQKMEACKIFIQSRLAFLLRNRHINVMTFSSSHHRQPGTTEKCPGSEEKIRTMIRKIMETFAFPRNTKEYILAPLKL